MDWVRRIRRDGRVLWRIISCRVERVVGCRRRRGVRPIFFLSGFYTLLTVVFPVAPRSMAHHYFDETIDSQSEYGDEVQSLMSAYSTADANTLGDLSPDAL